MGEMKQALEKNPTVLLEEKTDDICVACPHNKEGLCEAFEKVSRYDAGVLEKCGLNTGLQKKSKVREQKEPFRTDAHILPVFE